MDKNNFVFFDHRGKRWGRLRRLIICGVIIVFVSVIVFIRSIYVTPFMRRPTEIDPADELKVLLGNSEVIKDQISPAKILKSAPEQRKNILPNESQQVRLGYYVDWDEQSYNSLKNNAEHLTHLTPEWFIMKNSSGKFLGQSSAKVVDLAKENNIKLIPLLTNLDNDTWHSDAVENLILATRSKQEIFASALIKKLKASSASGVLLDWELLDARYKPQMTELLFYVAERLHEMDLELWLTIPINSDMNIYDIDRLALTIDKFVARMFDETSEKEPGQISSQKWFEEWLNALTQRGDAKKWIFALGNFGYDWAPNEAAQQIGFADVMSRAYHANLGSLSSGYDNQGLHFSYLDDGQSHTVLFLDALTFRNQYTRVLTSGAGGVAVFRLGTEDPALWNVLAQEGHLTTSQLETLETEATLSHVGLGEFVDYDSANSIGKRKITQGEDGLWKEEYLQYPRYPLMWHQGAKNSNQIAITFDDGPDPEYTAQILDVLKEKNVKAAFFLVGQNAASYPDIVKRIYAEGHEIGNHSYTHANLAEMSQRRAMLELNATQRIIESITGHVTTLFRPPYNADVKPANIKECTALEVAQRLGYLVVMQSIDSEDWQEPEVNELLRRIKERRREGNVLLFHDAGGDRSKTVEALPQIIDYLRRRGDEIVPLSTLVGSTPAALMPVPTKDSQQAVANAGFAILYYIEGYIWAFMIAATVLVMLRSLIVIYLSLKHKYFTSTEQNDNPAIRPPVSILIAAYNEGKVIRSTIMSLLKSDYQGALEILVVDDGSKDDTAVVVSKLTAEHKQVRLICQPNQGKAKALQCAIREARYEILVMLDADTQFESQTIRLLVAAILRPNIGAVSGHVKVGNTSKWLARFQNLEYICGFNLDRRAYTSWDCITVVPGAVCAFRKSAVIEAGGISDATLAEDTDLTLQLHRLGYRIDYCPEAIAWTEAPETIAGLAKQRTRWAFGTVQCLWKHRDLLFTSQKPGLGYFSLPSIWFFQLFLVALIPLVDFMLLGSILVGTGSSIVGYAIVFLIVDLTLAVLACLMEKEPLKNALYIIPMRLLYRPLLAYAVWCSIIRVMKGAWMGWGKLERQGNVARVVSETGEMHVRKVASL
ncbi:MAG: glycosyltransferase [Deltaproteobacteria bacterium]|nr:glycosyltransferase [Deltaproteobacteria bacterium]